MNEQLDIFGQNPRLSRLYTQLCFCFPLGDSQVTESSIVELIRGGLARLTSSIPWIAGQVVRDKDGVAKITQLNELPPLTIGNATNNLPCFNDFREACFPFNMLDESVIAPTRTIPGHSDMPAPVFSLQINFILGGVILAMDAQHNCMDLRGQSQIIKLLSKACRGEDFIEEDIISANLPRENIIPLLANDEISAIHKAQERPQESLSSGVAADWVYFSFSASTLGSLKTAATEDMTSDFVSTDDALSAFVWQSVTRARMRRLDSRDMKSTFERQVDSRRHLGISELYTGNVTCKVSVSMPLKDLLDHRLGAIASQLREAISPQADLGLQTRTAATQLHASLQSPPTTSPSRSQVSSTNIKMSSWAKEDCYNFDFGGLLGKPEAVRRPRFDAWEGLAYMMPRTLDGEIVVALCLRSDDLEALKTDEMFGKYAKYIG